MSNPYRGQPDRQFWSRAMTWPAPGHIDPVGRARIIRPGEKVATMGSCFAQHLARFIAKSGLDYFVPEAAPVGMTEADARERQYGVFSARYGNVYTVRQAIQLFDRAFGEFVPVEDVWESPGGFVDAFRPQIDPEASPSPGAVRAAAEEHLAQVRVVFSESRHLVFTLGLTEAWRSRRDGAVYPVAPGVAGGAFDPARHEFVNFTAREVSNDLTELIARIRRINPRCHIILTVSPVPLIATYEPRHVWVSTSFSKAALRVAADEAERAFEHVTYFPSYEIITSPAAGGRYYADDLRQVTDLGVGHVMRVFAQHFISGRSAPALGAAPAPAEAPAPAASQFDIVCDEEVIERALAASGLARPRAEAAPERETRKSDQSELMELNRQTTFFEILTARLYEMICKPGDVCVDAGGNFGDHTFGMLRAVGPTGRVHVIEAIPYLAERLRSIAKQQNLPLEVHELAVSDRLGVARFQHVKNIPAASGIWHRAHPEQPVETESIDVNLNRIDIFLKNHLSAWRFFKADIECGEYHAILGAKQLIKTYRPFITFENGFGTTANVVGYTKDDWFELFAMLNYRPYDLYGYEITPDRWPDFEQPHNSIAVSIGSADEAFVLEIWRDEIDRLAGEVRSGVRKWPPPAVP